MQPLDSMNPQRAQEDWHEKETRSSRLVSESLEKRALRESLSGERADEKLDWAADLTHSTVHN